jgi:hypothetical protein
MNKKTDELRTKIESIRDRLANRIEQLTVYEEQYKDSGDLEDAVRCSIKWRALEVVLRNLDEALL